MPPPPEPRAAGLLRWICRRPDSSPLDAEVVTFATGLCEAEDGEAERAEMVTADYSDAHTMASGGRSGQSPMESGGEDGDRSAPTPKTTENTGLGRRSHSLR